MQNGIDTVQGSLAVLKTKFCSVKQNEYHLFEYVYILPIITTAIIEYVD